MIGPRAAGKTSYLAALAYWPDANNKNIEVTPITGAAEKLKAKAQNKILQGISLEQNKIDGIKIKSFYDLPLYQFTIESKMLGGLKKARIELVVRDYPGEVFNELANGIANEVHREFMEKCFVGDVVGCLIMLHEWETGRDNFYNRAFENFIKLMKENERLANLRLAVAMSKCERGELWPGRLEPEIDIFREHLPRTTKTLRKQIPEKNLRFYALSTFGVLERNDPRPNRRDEILGGKGSVLRKPKQWRPYGMMSPLYWLSGS